MELPFTIEQVMTFMLILIRVGAIIIALPLFGSKDIPRIAKAGIIILLTILVYPCVDIPPGLSEIKLLALLPSIISEIIIGAMIGFSTKLIFESVQLAGNLIGMQMGFGIARVMDPITGTQFSVVSQFFNILITLLFIATNMHHLFISAIVVSFEKIPLLQCYLSASLFEYIIKISSNLFFLAIKLGAPIIAILLFTTAAFGMINKSVPQLHIMIIGMPLKITAGLVAIGLIMPTFIMMLKRTFPLLEGYVYNTISLAKLP